MDRLAFVASLVLVVLLAHSLARLTWIVLPAPSQAPPPAQAAPAVQQRADYRQIANLHLFGQPPQTAAQRDAPIDAPETRLNLTLRGILFNTDPQLARAIISAPGKEDAAYRVGNEVPGGATIEQIYADRVMLLRNGQYETLRLPEEGVDVAAAPRTAAAPPPVGGQPDPATLLAARQRIKANPQNSADFIRAEPVNRGGGGLVGFRVRPGPQPEAFHAAGLQEGDIVTSINGIRLDSVEKAPEALMQLTTAEVVNLSVLRQGSEFNIQLQLQNAGDAVVDQEQ